MALDPKKYDIAAFEKARAKFNEDARKGKVGTFDVNKFLLPGQTPPGATNLPGTGTYNPTFGGIPGVPDPVSTTATTIAGNLANFEDLETLTGRTNRLLFDQYAGRLPGYSDLASTSSANILANLRGEIPQDVVNLIGQQAAERGIAGGVSGSQFSNADYLRALGLTSLGLKEKGEAGFTGATDRLKGIPSFDPSTMFTKPEDVYGAYLQSNIFKAAPDPAAAATYAERLARAPFDENARRRAAELWEKNRTVINVPAGGKPFGF